MTRATARVASASREPRTLPADYCEGAAALAAANGHGAAPLPPELAGLHMAATERDDELAGKLLEEATGRRASLPIAEGKECPRCGEPHATLWRSLVDNSTRYTCDNCFAGFDGQDLIWPGAPEARTHGLPLDEFLAATYPRVEEIIPGLLAAGSHTLAHGAPGLGKSNLSTTVAVSIASGRSTLPGFEVRQRVPSLYIDGEMVPRLVQDRFRLHMGILGAEAADLRDWLRVVSRIAVQASTGERVPSLATAAGRQWLLRELDAFPARVVFVDTVRALMRHPEHSLSDEEGWRPCEELLAELSARGVSVFYQHHDGKNLEQLGTSAREHDPSYILHLTKPKKAGIGWCRFRLEETKGRLGPTFAPVELVLEPEAAGEASCWQLVEADEVTKGEQILRHHAADPAAPAVRIAELVRTTPAHVRSVLSKAKRGAA